MDKKILFLMQSNLLCAVVARDGILSKRTNIAASFFGFLIFWGVLSIA